MLGKQYVLRRQVPNSAGAVPKGMIPTCGGLAYRVHAHGRRGNAKRDRMTEESITPTRL
jgi:hypothetical protein